MHDDVGAEEAERVSARWEDFELRDAHISKSRYGAPAGLVDFHISESSVQSHDILYTLFRGILIHFRAGFREREGS